VGVDAVVAVFGGLDDHEERLGRGEFVFLGVIDDRAHFALDLSPIEAPAEMLRSPVLGAAGIAAPGIEITGLRFADLRQLAGRLAHHEGALLAFARAMMFWHSRHRFCGLCGAPTRSEEAGHMRRCSDESCKAMHFPRTDPAVIMLVTQGERALLGRNKNFIPGMYSTLAGFVEPGESLEDAVAREVREETGIEVGAVIYHSSQPWPFPANIMLGFQAEAVSSEIAVDYGELEDAVACRRRVVSSAAPRFDRPAADRGLAARRLTATTLRGNRPLPRLVRSATRSAMLVKSLASAGFAVLVCLAGSAEPVPAQTSATPPLRSAPASPDQSATEQGQSGSSSEPLSQKLDRSSGVIRPPAHVDPGLTQPAPSVGSKSTPVIPPPGTSGTSPGVDPK
jgi:NAD+ diphosphatase